MHKNLRKNLKLPSVESSVIITLLFLVLVFGILIFGASKVDLQFWDEATNLSVIVESAQQDDWWNLRFNGEYFWEKPPLYYWLGIVTFKVGELLVAALGDTVRIDVVTLLRGINIVVFTAITYLIYYFLSTQASSESAQGMNAENASAQGMNAENASAQGMNAQNASAQAMNIQKSLRNAILLAILFFSNFIFWQFTPAGTLATHNFRSVDVDPLQILFIIWGYFAQEIIIQRLVQEVGGIELQKRDYLCLLVLGLTCGLAVMVKGPLGFLPLVIFLFQVAILFFRHKINLYSKSERQNFFCKHFLVLIILPIVVSLAVILPWHVYMYSKFGSAFIDQYFIYHQLQRASTALEGHVQPIWFYFEFLLDPRNLVLFYLTVVNFIFSKFRITKELIIAAILVLFFSMVPTKLSWYILPAFVFLIIYNYRIIVEFITKSNGRSFRKKIFLGQFVFIILFAVTNIFLMLGAASRFDQRYGWAQDKQICYISTRKPHRAFYALQLVHNDLARCDLTAQNEIQREYLVDLHETSEIYILIDSVDNCEAKNLQNLSQNYGKLLVRCEQDE